MNLKKLFVFSSALLIAFTMVAEAQKIAVVDMETVIKSHPKAEQNDKALRAMQADLEGKRDALLAGLKTQQDEIVKLEKDIRSNPMYSEKVKREMAEKGRQLVINYEKSEKEIRGKVAEMQRELSREEHKLFAEVMTDIQAAVKSLSESSGYDMVLDLSAYRTGAPIPIIIYNAPNTDITDEVIKAIGGVRKTTPAE